MAERPQARRKNSIPPHRDQFAAAVLQEYRTRGFLVLECEFSRDH
ncbi:hypothetical protein ACF07U_12555 [Streptomyces californicus]